MVDMERFEELSKWAEEALETTAAKKKKLDPKAKVRNRKKPVFPHNSPKVKDNKDHFPLGSEDQARAALSYAGHYTKAPSWYKGSLEELKSAVRRAVKRHYPNIEVSEPKKKKRSSVVAYGLIEKYAELDDE
jgi:hypothetical protein